MGGTSEILVSWWSCCWVVCVCVRRAFPKLSPWLPRWADLSEEPACSLCFRHWNTWSPSGSGDLKPAVVCRGWQSCGFKSGTTMLCVTSSALSLTGAEAHLRQTTLHVFLRSLLESMGECRAARATWGLMLYASELCGNGRDHHGEGWAVARHCSLAAFRAFCWTWSLAQRLSPSSPARQQFGPLCLPPPLLLALPATYVPNLFVTKGVHSKILWVLVRSRFPNYPNTLFEMLYRSCILPESVPPFLGSTRSLFRFEKRSGSMYRVSWPPLLFLPLQAVQSS